MGRTFQRYLFRQILLPFAAGLALFTFILLIARIMKLVELVVNRGVPILEVLKVFAYILPAFLEVTVPMALLLACLMACGRLSADSEFVAMKASGLSLYQFARPFAVVAGAVWLLSTLLAVHVRPLGNAGLKASIFELARTRASAGLKEHVFNDDFKGLVIYVDQIEPPGNELRRILISDRRNPDQHNTVIARRGLLVPDEDARTLDLRLFEGTIFTNADGETNFHKTDFGSYDVSLDLAEALGQLDRSAKDPSEMTLGELRERIRRLEEAGERSGRERVEWMRRFSVPFASLVFTLLAIPLGLQPVRAVRSRGLALSLAIILLYYVMLSAAETLATQGRVPVGVALWAPNVLLGLVGAILFRRAARERPLSLESRLADVLSSLRGREGGAGAAVPP
jgi:lipopolysaccharide export system permease protein